MLSLFAAAAVACPGSYSPIHAGASMTVQFENSCADVAEEISMRASAPKSTWQDPHNRGTYTLEESNGASYIKVKRVTANRVFTDRSDFTMTANGNGGCTVQGCSESQGISAADKGTNICDMFSLFCNSQDCSGGTCCKSLKHDLKYTIENKKCYPFFFNCPGSMQAVRNTCIKNPATEEELIDLQKNAIKLARMGAFENLEAELTDESAKASFFE